MGGHDARMCELLFGKLSGYLSEIAKSKKSWLPRGAFHRYEVGFTVEPYAPSARLSDSCNKLIDERHRTLLDMMAGRSVRIGHCVMRTIMHWNRSRGSLIFAAAFSLARCGSA